MSVTKSSTRLLKALTLAGSLALPLALVTVMCVPATAQAARPTGPVELAPNAPDTYTVVKGDTLWDISAKFLKSPWRWPEVWNLNKEQIRDPHWIYPGDLITLDMSSGTPRLRLGRRVGGSDKVAALGTTRLEPSARPSNLGRDAVPTLSMAAIKAFINRPLIVTPKQLSAAPRIVGTQEGRVYLGVGDKAYVRGISDDSQSEWHVYRPAREVRDPDTGRTLAWEALYLGSGTLVRKGDPATLQITSLAEEIGPEDRLVATESKQTTNFVPHAPEQDLRGKIVSVYRGVSQVGRNSVVSLNLGSEQGIEAGHVMSIESSGKVVRDFQSREAVKLPDETIGQLLVFRTFDNISYALVVDASGPITIGDTVVTP